MQFFKEEFSKSIDSLRFAKVNSLANGALADVAKCDLDIGLNYVRLAKSEKANQSFHSSLRQYRLIGDYSGLASTLLEIKKLDLKPNTRMGLFSSLYFPSIQFIIDRSPPLGLSFDTLCWPIVRRFVSPLGRVFHSRARANWHRMIGDTSREVLQSRNTIQLCERHGHCGTDLYRLALSAVVKARINERIEIPNEEFIQLAKAMAAHRLVFVDAMAAATTLSLATPILRKEKRTAEANELCNLRWEIIDQLKLEGNIPTDHRVLSAKLMILFELRKFGANSDSLKFAVEMLDSFEHRSHPSIAANLFSITHQIYLQRNQPQIAKVQFDLAKVNISRCVAQLKDLVSGRVEICKTELDAFLIVDLSGALNIQFSSQLSNPIDNQLVSLKETSALLKSLIVKLKKNRPLLTNAIELLETQNDNIWISAFERSTLEWLKTGFKPSCHAELASLPMIESNSFETVLVQFSKSLNNGNLEEIKKTVEVLNAVLDDMVKGNAGMLSNPIWKINAPLIRFMKIAYCDDDFIRGLPYLHKACEEFETFSARATGQPDKVLLDLNSIRSLADPFSIGQQQSRLHSNTAEAIKFAMRGRGIATRVAIANASREKKSTVLFDSIRLDFNPDLVPVTAEKLGSKEKYLLLSAIVANAPNKLMQIQPVDEQTAYLLGDDGIPHDLTNNFQADFDNKQEGVLASYVVPNSVAAGALIAPFDIISKFDGQAVDSRNLADVVRESKTKKQVKIEFVRDKKIIETSAKGAELFGIGFLNGSPKQAWQTLALKTPLAVEGYAKKSVNSISRIVESNRSRHRSKKEKETEVPPEAISYTLFRSLFSQKLWNEIKKCERLYVSLPAELSGLPLETLIVEPPVYGNRRHVRWLDVGPPIIYLPAGRLQRKWEERSTASREQFSLVAVGGVDFSQFTGFESLPGTKEEATNAQSFVGKENTTLLLGEDATETNLLAAAKDSRFILISTHGDPKFNEQLLETAVLLTPTTESDGRLTLAEIISKWRDQLGNTDTVILSSCQSNRGLDVHDETSLALPFGMLMAGAESVIASQWPVDDEATAELFSEYFRQISLGKSSLDAFTIARKHVRAIDKFADPYYWAPFIFISQ